MAGQIHKIYVASSWRNPHQRGIVELLRGLGHYVYDFKEPTDGMGIRTSVGFSWGEVDPQWKTWTAEQYIHALRSNPRCAQGYLSDHRAMEWADSCVLILPSGRSAHLEAGWFKGRGKQLVILTQSGEEPELMALMADYLTDDPNVLKNIFGWPNYKAD